MIHHPARTPKAVTSRYPSHLHLNLLPRVQGRGLGKALFENWRGIAVVHGTKGIHVAVNRANRRAIPFWQRIGFTELDMPGNENPRTVWMGQD